MVVVCSDSLHCRLNSLYKQQGDKCLCMSPKAFPDGLTEVVRHTLIWAALFCRQHPELTKDKNMSGLTSISLPPDGECNVN